jgi:hypothetical protein
MDLSDHTISRLYFVDLDLVLHDSTTDPDELETPEDAAALLAHMMAVDFKVLVEHGPAGGWPIVRFTGSRTDLELLIHRYNSDDALSPSGHVNINHAECDHPRTPAGRASCRAARRRSE